MTLTQTLTQLLPGVSINFYLSCPAMPALTEHPSVLAKGCAIMEMTCGRGQTQKITGFSVSLALLGSLCLLWDLGVQVPMAIGGSRGILFDGQ